MSTVFENCFNFLASCLPREPSCSSAFLNEVPSEQPRLCMRTLSILNPALMSALDGLIALNWIFFPLFSKREPRPRNATPARGIAAPKAAPAAGVIASVTDEPYCKPAPASIAVPLAGHRENQLGIEV